MDERHEETDKRPAGADRGREGFGDDGGTRVGRPDSAKGTGAKGDLDDGPSTQPVSEGIEGSILEPGDDSATRRASAERDDSSGPDRETAA